MVKRIFSVITATALAFSIASCGKKEEKPVLTATNVTVSEAVEDSIASTVKYTGEVAAQTSASVSPKAAGTVLKINAEVGDYVKAGSVLMTLDSTSYSLALNQANAALSQAQAAYNNVKNGSNAQSQISNNQALANAQTAYDTALDNYNRQKALFDIGAISQVALDGAKTQLDNATVALNTAKSSANLNSNVIGPQAEATAKAAVAQAKAAVDIAAQNVANCTVRAPISGYISAKKVTIGQMASQGVEAFAIKDSNAVDVEINVTESVIGYLSDGDKATVSIKSAGLKNIDAIVCAVGEAKNDASGMFPVKISIPNKDGKVKVGMVAQVELTTQRIDNAIVVPADSVMQTGDEYYVFVANGNKVKKTTVEVGVTDGKNIQIVNGITKGQKVVVEGKEYLSDTNNEINITK